MADDDVTPDPAVAVSPDDHSSDRAQSDADNEVAVASQASASAERQAAREQADVHQAEIIESIEALTAQSKRQTASNEALALAAYAEAQSRTEMQERARLARRRFRITIVAIALTAIAVLTGVLVVLAQVYTTVDSGKQVRHTLLDCVQPTGQCYKDGQKQTAKVVGSLNQVTALAAACAPDYVSLPINERIPAIQRCIEKGLTK